MFVEVQNCNRSVKFIPEVVYPGKYFCVGECALFEKLGKSEKPMVTLKIDGESCVNKAGDLTAICQKLDCPHLRS